jgi:hypothetical protein
MKLRICEMIGVSYFDWEPSDEFILDYIDGDIPEDSLCEMALAAYLASPIPPEDNPSDEEPPPDESADLIRISQYSCEHGLPNIGYRFSNRGFWLAERDRRKGPRSLRTRRRSYRDYRNSESHCPKYGRQDERHQAPRIEAKYERRFAAYEAMMEAYYRAQDESLEDEARNATNLTDAEMEALNARFAFPEDYLFHEDREIERKMEEMARAFGHTIDDPCDIAGRPGYMPDDFRRRGYYGPDRGSHSGRDRHDYDPMDDYGCDSYADSRDGVDDNGDDEPCDCHDCREESEHQRDDEVGMLENGHLSNAYVAYLDALVVSHSSNKRRTYHVLEVLKKEAAFV